MAEPTYTLSAKLWSYPGDAGWHFVTLPARVELGASTWTTSLFADTKSSSYLIPIKAEMRRREGIENGDTITMTIEIEIEH
jgi:hypothetical protein